MFKFYFKENQFMTFCVICVTVTKSLNGNIIQNINLHGHHPQLQNNIIKQAGAELCQTKLS